MITYEELAIAISKMTDVQKKMPVKMYIDGELHPSDTSSHPDYKFSSRLVLEEELTCSDPDYANPNQYVIEEYMSEEGTKACAILWAKINKYLERFTSV